MIVLSRRVDEESADDAWTPLRNPGAVLDPDTGELISEAEVAECVYTAFASTRHEITARLVVRRIRDETMTTPCSRSGATTPSSPTPHYPQ